MQDKIGVPFCPEWCIAAERPQTALKTIGLTAGMHCSACDESFRTVRCASSVPLIESCAGSRKHLNTYHCSRLVARI